MYQKLSQLNTLTSEQRRRLMSGEKLEDIIGIKQQKSRYYNTSDIAANSIPLNELFE